MSKYTAEQVEEITKWAAHLADPVRFASPAPATAWPGDTAAQMLRDYAALLRERESAKAGVTEEMVEVAVNAHAEWFGGHRGMRAALEAVAPMLTRARAPDGYTALLSDGKRYWSDKPGQHGEWLPYYLGVPVDGYVMPKGWQLVPAELTLSMSVRGKWALCDHSIKPEDFKRAWREMLAAAPKPTNVWPVDAREKAFSLAREMLQKGSAKPETEE